MIHYYNWWIKQKKWNIGQPKGIEDFSWCVLYSLFQQSTVSLISFIIYLFIYYFYVGVVGDLYSLENWYYRILILMTGYLQNATLAVDALSIWYVVFFSTHVISYILLSCVYQKIKGNGSKRSKKIKKKMLEKS